MLSETLANLTRRIAEEFDHLSDSDTSSEAPQRGTGDPRLTAISRSVGTAGHASAEEPRTCTSSHSQDDVPPSISDAPASPPSADEDGPVAASDRRPAKKAAASAAETTTSSDSETSSDAPRASKDWQRTVIN